MKLLQDDIEKRESFLLQGGVASQGLEGHPSFATAAGNNSVAASPTQAEETFVTIKIENE